MERSLVVFGILFIVIPLLLAAGALVVPGFAFAAALILLVLLSFGFMFGIAFVDLHDA